MRRLAWIGIVVALAMVLTARQAAAAGPGQVVIVQPGDTLHDIAARNGTTVQALAATNGLTDVDWIWPGERLVIPAPGTGPDTVLPVSGSQTLPITPGAPVPVTGTVTTTVQGATVPVTPTPSSGGAQNPGDKWIDVNLTEQRMTAYEGQVPVRTTLASTGLPRTPTVVVTYYIYAKLLSDHMVGGSKAQGDYYDLPNVPYVLYFYEGYSLHGTYWHHNFGHPMSHGCVNLPTEEAKWLYAWAPIGTRVVIHY